MEVSKHVEVVMQATIVQEVTDRIVEQGTIAQVQADQHVSQGTHVLGALDQIVEVGLTSYFLLIISWY
jgi:hypothetical protein